MDVAAGETTLYYYNPDWQCLEERNSAGTLLRSFVYGNSIDEVLLMDDGADRYYVHDHLYSPAALLSAAAAVLERYEYDAYGRVHVIAAGADGLWYTADDVLTETSAQGNPYTFTGRRLDTLDAGDLPLMYYRHRYYSPQTGRFLQQDPLGYVDGMGLYQYVKSSPMISSDPFGTQVHPWEEWVYRQACWYADPELIEDAVERAYLEFRSIWNELPAFYINGEFMFIIGGGITRVSCLDECGKRRCFWYLKVCAGAGVGFGISTGHVRHMDGRNCRAETYEGMFREVGLGWGTGGAEYAWDPDPRRPVDSIGGGGILPIAGAPSLPGKVGARAVWCKYYYINPGAHAEADGLGWECLWGCN